MYVPGRRGGVDARAGREAAAQARSVGHAVYVLCWVDGRITWQPTIDRLDRLFARRITRIERSGQRTVETARLRAPSR